MIARGGDVGGWGGGGGTGVGDESREKGKRGGCTSGIKLTVIDCASRKAPQGATAAAKFVRLGMIAVYTNPNPKDNAREVGSVPARRLSRARHPTP